MKRRKILSAFSINPCQGKQALFKGSYHPQILPGISKSSQGSPYVPKELQNFPGDLKLFPGMLKPSRDPQMFPRDLQLFPRISENSQLLQLFLGNLQLFPKIIRCSQGSSKVPKDTQLFLEIYKFNLQDYYNLQDFPRDDQMFPGDLQTFQENFRYSQRTADISRELQMFKESQDVQSDL